MRRKHLYRNRQRKKPTAPADDVHDAYGSGRLLLVFGRHRDGRIIHIQNVERGASCDCRCPACGADLIARQGEVLAWHFAHANGQDCKAAQEEALRALLVQQLVEGGSLLLPREAVQWGRGERDARPARPATLSQESPDLQNQPGSPTSLKDSFGEIVVEIRILSGDGPRSPLETGSHSILEIDMRLASVNDDLEGLLEALSRSAPRRWMRSDYSECRRHQIARDRIIPHLDALLGASSPQANSGEPIPEIEVLERHHLGSFLKGPLIAGERFLSMESSCWRAAAVHDLFLAPMLRQKDLRGRARRTVTGQDIERWVLRRGLDRFASISQRLDEDDRYEVMRLVGDFRRPEEVVIEFFDQLAARHFLCATHGRAHSTSPAHLDLLIRDKMAVKGWVLHDRIEAHVQRILAAEALIEAR